MDNLKVNCYSGHTYAERPRSFTWEGAEYDVEAIEKAHSKLPVDDFRSRISNIIRVYTEEKESEL